MLFRGPTDQDRASRWPLLGAGTSAAVVVLMSALVVIFTYALTSLAALVALAHHVNAHLPSEGES